MKFKKVSGKIKKYFLVKVSRTTLKFRGFSENIRDILRNFTDINVAKILWRNFVEILESVPRTNAENIENIFKIFERNFF